MMARGQGGGASFQKSRPLEVGVWVVLRGYNNLTLVLTITIQYCDNRHIVSADSAQVAGGGGGLNSVSLRHSPPLPASGSWRRALTLTNAS